MRAHAVILVLLLAATGLGAAPRHSTQAKAPPAAKPGVASGYVRVNGESVAVKHAYGFVVPDSFDPKKPVRLILVSPDPIAADAIAKASTRGDVFRLLEAGAFIELSGEAHYVILRHEALRGLDLRTGGKADIKPANANRLAGTVTTWMSGDSETLGYKVGWNITFDAPILKQIPLGK